MEEFDTKSDDTDEAAVSDRTDFSAVESDDIVLLSTPGLLRLSGMGADRYMKGC